MRGLNKAKIPDRIISDIESERGYASKYWDAEFDSKNTVNDWATYINIYLSRATRMRTNTDKVSESLGAQRERQRVALVKVAGLAISALEAFDENGGFQERHYD